MNPIVYKGVVKGNNVVLEEGTTLPEGTKVLVTPIEVARGSPQAVLSAIDAPPRLKSEDVAELLRLIEEGKIAVSYKDPFKS